MKRKINLHITEACNYHCKYCFAHFSEHKKNVDWKKIIDNCADSNMIDSINFAGGEPLLVKELSQLALYAKNKGMSCSIISNGSLMDNKWIKENAKLFDTIGISIDSMNETTELEIGRSYKGVSIGHKELLYKLDLIKEISPETKIKINTVVNKYNYKEILLNKIACMPVDRWKILKAMLFTNKEFDNSGIIISDKDYIDFVKNNLRFIGENFEGLKDKDVYLYKAYTGLKIVIEQRLMGTYLMVDAGGYLVDDTKNTNYVRVASLETEPFKEAVKRLNFRADLYNNRY